MRRCVVLGLVLLGGLLGCWGLRDWVAGGSVRFYLLVPFVAVAFQAAVAWDWRAALKRAVRQWLTCYAVMAFLCAVFSLYLAKLTGLPATGTWREVIICAYLLTGVCYLIAAAYLAIDGLVRHGGRFLHSRPLGPRSEAAVRWASLCVLTALVTPYLIALTYVHRFKMPNVAAPDEVTGRAYEDVAFTSADGLTMRGWFFRAARRESDRTVLICHGLGLNRSAFLSYLKVADALDAHALIFDFRGHGDSDGRTVTLGTIRHCRRCGTRPVVRPVH
jgi:hypothetical protein